MTELACLTLFIIYCCYYYNIINLTLVTVGEVAIFGRLCSFIHSFIFIKWLLLRDSLSVSLLLFAVAATLKSIDCNVAMTFILNNNNNNHLNRCQWLWDHAVKGGSTLHVGWCVGTCNYFLLRVACLLACYWLIDWLIDWLTVMQSLISMQL